MKLPAVEFMEELKGGCEAWRVVCELAGMEENAEILYRSYVTLSPGERTKILLEVLFSGDNDFLLTDEPTNHLDWDAEKVSKRILHRRKALFWFLISSWWENEQRKDRENQNRV